MPSRQKAIIALFSTACLWSLGGVLIKWVQWHPMAIAGMRSIIAIPLLLLWVKKPKFTWSRTQIAAALAYTATVSLFVIANKLTTAANAIMLQYTAPIYVALFGVWLLGERARFFDWLTIAFALVGMSLFFLDQLSPSGYLGNACALFSGITFAFVVLLMRKQKDGSSTESIILGNLFTAAVGAPFMFQSFPDAKGWIGLVLLGTVQLGLSYALYAYATRHVRAIEAIIIPMIEPVLNPIWVLLLLGERPGKWALAGGAVILSTVAIRCMYKETDPINAVAEKS